MFTLQHPRYCCLNSPKNHSNNGNVEPPAKISHVDLFNILPSVNPFAFLCLVDTRTKEKFRAKHIMGAVNMPIKKKDKFKALVKRFEKLKCEASNTLIETVVLYNEKGKQLDNLQELIKLISSKLNVFRKDIRILAGGYREFEENYPFICLPEGSSIDPNHHYPSIIVPHFLYLGGSSCTHQQILDDVGITYILNLAVECKKEYSNCKYLNFDLVDENHQDIKSMFDEAFKFIDEAMQSHKRILIHCKAGISRSATIVIGYLMKTKKWRLRDTITFVSERRKIVLPNKGFMKQLVEYESTLNHETVNFQ